MKNKKLVVFGLLLVSFVLALIINPVLAQTEEEPTYRMGINRDFGYGAGASIKGLFSLTVVGPEGIASVVYYLDDQVMATVTESPFKFQFNTTQYAYGWHDLTAVVTNTAGEVFTTPARHMNFVTAEEESAGMQKVIIPILGLTVGVMLLVSGIQFAVMRKRNPGGVEPGTERSYGFAGGSICRKCGRPTPRHMWGMNLGIGKLDRCENCGKWSIMQAAPLDILRAAEIAEKDALKTHTPVKEKTEEEKLRDLIDKSKYE